MGDLQVRTERNGNGTVLALAGELDLSSAPAFEDALEDACRQDTPQVTVDLSDLGFMDSSGLRALIKAYRWTQERRIPLALVRGRPAVHRVFELTGMDRFFTIRPA